MPDAPNDYEAPEVLDSTLSVAACAAHDKRLAPKTDAAEIPLDLKVPSLPSTIRRAPGRRRRRGSMASKSSHDQCTAFEEEAAPILQPEPPRRSPFCTT